MKEFLLANSAILPELFLFKMSILILMISVFIKKCHQQLTHTLTQITLWGAIALVFWTVPEKTTWLFSKTLVVDHLALVLKVSAYATASLLCFYGNRYLTKAKMPRDEFYALALLSLLGMSVLISANHFITLFVGLELLSLPIYTMIAMRRDQTIAIEAAIKYLLIGAIATGILLYGASLMYAGTQRLMLTEIAQVMTAAAATNHLLMAFALVFIVAGLGFKLGVVPFHMWLPDVYEGAPTIMTLYVATISKIAAVGMALRILTLALPGIMFDWQQLLIVLIVASLLVGNIGAVIQTNLKRMLAYSAIAQMGYLLLGLVAGTKSGYDAAVFYLVTYVLTTLVAFTLIMCFQKKNGSEAVMIADYAGLSKTSPWFSLMFLVTFFSLAGVPPLVGFMAKFQVFQALIATGPVWLAVVSLLLAVVAAYYYIYVVKVIYFDESQEALQCVADKVLTPVLSANTLAVLIFGLLPSALIMWCHI